MKVEVIPLTGFIHGSIIAVEGKSVEMEKSLAEDLQRAGLVRVNLSPKAEGDQAGKDEAAGQEAPSSVSPVAQASPQRMFAKPSAGEGKVPKKERR